MRFKRGSKVEVLNKKEVPTSWRVAEIISGNGHMYNLRYDGYSGVEKVSRKVIRPCPPPATENWVTGDVVEVFDENSWKVATVRKVFAGGQCLVRTHGLNHEVGVLKSNIRARLSWKDGQWIPIEKISESHGGVKLSKTTRTNCCQKLVFQGPLADSKIYQGEGFSPVYNDVGLQESHVVSSKTLKRASPFCSSFLGAGPGRSKKFKAVEKEHGRKLIPGHLLDKVDAFAYPGETLGNKYMQASFNNSLNGYYEMEKGKSNGVVGCSLARISEPNDSDNDQCSVGSCSVSSDGPNKLSRHCVAVPCQETDILSSDAESFNTSRDEEGNCSPPPEEEVAASIHRLELHAYRCTLEALYASGPLSWEKEALLTNLRINLHISNDEHLTELRHLISSGAGPQLEACISCFQRSKQDSGFCCLSLGKKQWDNSCMHLLQIRQFVAVVTYLKPQS